MVATVAAESGRDAGRVAAYLDSLGIRGTPDNPVRLDPNFLLVVAAALRLREWELLGVPFHIDIGLPPARDVLESAFHEIKERGTIPNGAELAARVMALFLERFAWHSGFAEDAPVALDVFDDAALEAVADFLWQHRNDRHHSSILEG
jgi:hypothetical protein